MSDIPAVRLAPAPDPAPAVEDPPAAPPVGRPASPAPSVEPLLVGTDHAAAMCGISPASWYRLKAAGKTPAPVQLGGKVLYRVEDLRLFVSWGCPDRRVFEAMKNANRRK